MRRRRHYSRLHKHNTGICHFNKRFSVGCVACSTCGICFTLFVAVGIFFFFFSRPCTNDSQCQMENPCTIDSCDNGWCRNDRVENCCSSDSECGDASCYNSFCDIFQHTCRTIPKSNGSSCEDSNACTIEDKCNNGACMGKTLTCDVGNDCRSGYCKNGIGCVFHNKPNGYSCNDNNPCTSEDECYNGMCAVGYTKDCSSLDTQCTIGACDVTSGNCVALPRNNGAYCDDGQQCTENDRCDSGTCKGTHKSCQDNNPCTIDRCVEGVGCMVQHQDYGEQCIPGCLQNTDCPFEYNCFDGTCIKTYEVNNQAIRMLGYEIETCGDGKYKLEQHFVLDTQKFMIGNEVRYRIVKSTNDINAHPQYAPLGFGNEVKHLAFSNFGTDTARTAFTISTKCQRFDASNCAYLFTNREFRFAAKMHDCLDITGPLAQNCLDPNHVIWASISTSISSCGHFPGHVNVNYPRGNAVLYYNNQYFRKGLNQWQFNVYDDDRKGYVGIETDLYNRPDQYAVITDMRICQANAIHYLAQCVDGTNHSECYNTGCFNWDPIDSPLGWQMDVIKGGEVTSMALSSEFEASGCYGNSQYDATSSTICTWDKCNSLSMDDNFRFKFRPMHNILTLMNDIFIFDIRYKHVFCGVHTRRRRLLTANQSNANYTTNFSFSEGHYSMAVFQFQKAN